MRFMGTDRKPLRWLYYLPKSWVILAVLVVWIFNSCDLDLIKPTLRVPFTSEIQFDIDSLSLKSDVFILHEETTNLDIDSLIRHYGGNPELITGAEIKSVTLTVIEPEGTDIGFLESSSVTIFTETIQETTIAVSDDNSISETQITYDLPEETADLLEFVSQGDTYTVRIYGIVSPPLPVDYVNLLLEITWEISVTPL